MARRFSHAMAAVVFAPGFGRRKQTALTKKVLKTIPSSQHVLATALLEGLLDDIRYNDDMNSDDVVGSTVMQPLAGEPGHGFTQLGSAGELRAMAQLLHNCAASRVWLGVAGVSSFWRYHNATTGEVALLQLHCDTFPATDCVVEFNGLRNQGVSETARRDLQAWLAGQSQ